MAKPGQIIVFSILHRCCQNKKLLIKFRPCKRRKACGGRGAGATKNVQYGFSNDAISPTPLYFLNLAAAGTFYIKCKPNDVCETANFIKFTFHIEESATRLQYPSVVWREEGGH